MSDAIIGAAGDGGIAAITRIHADAGTPKNPSASWPMARHGRDAASARQRRRVAAIKPRVLRRRELD
jgi:hypothetical protein